MKWLELQAVNDLQTALALNLNQLPRLLWAFSFGVAASGLLVHLDHRSWNIKSII